MSPAPREEGSIRPKAVYSERRVLGAELPDLGIHEFADIFLREVEIGIMILVMTISICDALGTELEPGRAYPMLLQPARVVEENFYLNRS